MITEARPPMIAVVKVTEQDKRKAAYYNSYLEYRCPCGPVIGQQQVNAAYDQEDGPQVPYIVPLKMDISKIMQQEGRPDQYQDHARYQFIVFHDLNFKLRV
jgi:hypothetical protein